MAAAVGTCSGHTENVFAPRTLPYSQGRHHETGCAGTGGRRERTASGGTCGFILVFGRDFRETRIQHLALAPSCWTRSCASGGLHFGARPNAADPASFPTRASGTVTIYETAGNKVYCRRQPTLPSPRPSRSNAWNPCARGSCVVWKGAFPMTQHHPNGWSPRHKQRGHDTRFISSQGPPSRQPSIHCGGHSAQGFLADHVLNSPAGESYGEDEIELLHGI